MFASTSSAGRIAFHRPTRLYTAPHGPSRRAVPARPRRLRLMRRGGGWSLWVDGLDEPAWTVPTKRHAVASATDAARYHRCRLEIYRRDGTLQRVQAANG